jgi:Leucine-rich repeat (LRR) protein
LWKIFQRKDVLKMIRFVLFSIVIGCVCIGATNTSSFLECPQSHPICGCTKTTNEDGSRKLEIECASGDNQITIVKELSTNNIQFIRLDCGYGNDSFVASLIPALGMANIFGLQIQHCRTTSPKTALVPVFNRLGVARATLARLEVMENDLVDLPEDLLQDLPQLKHFDLRSNRLRHLEIPKFRQLANLTVLDLGDNQLTSIPPNIFANFRYLRFLNLWNNSLTTLHGVTFTGVTNLEQLDLSCNHLQVIAADIFTNLPSLTTINLGGNSFGSLPENLLMHNPRLEYFRLNNNRTPLRLSSKLFSNLTNLNDVELSSSKCLQLPETIFANNSNLQKLSLARNQISALPSQIFSNQRNMIHLDLSHNSLIRLNDNLLHRMTKLQVVKLSHNLINKIPEYDL